MRDDRLHPVGVDGNTEHGMGKERAFGRNLVPVIGAACLDNDDLEVVRCTLLWSVS